MGRRRNPRRRRERRRRMRATAARTDPRTGNRGLTRADQIRKGEILAPAAVLAVIQVRNPAVIQAQTQADPEAETDPRNRTGRREEKIKQGQPRKVRALCLPPGSRKVKPRIMFRRRGDYVRRREVTRCGPGVRLPRAPPRSTLDD